MNIKLLETKILNALAHVQFETSVDVDERIAILNRIIESAQKRIAEITKHKLTRKV